MDDDELKVNIKPGIFAMPSKTIDFGPSYSGLHSEDSLSLSYLEEEIEENDETTKKNNNIDNSSISSGSSNCQTIKKKKIIKKKTSKILTKEVPYTFTWDEGGKEIKITGTFAKWSTFYEMKYEPEEKRFKCVINLPREKHEYKFIVDGIWKFSKKQKTIDDGKGNINNILDLTDVKQKEEIKNNISNKRNNKNQNKNSKKKEKNKKRKNTLNKEENKFFKKREYGNDYPNYSNLSEPNNSDILSEAFNINNESKQKKLGLQKYYKYKPNNSYSSNKSYLNISNYRHTILNHILLQKEINKKNKDKIGISFRYREKAITLIYFN